MKRSRNPAPRFSARQHALATDATVDHDGAHFMTVRTKAGAERLAAILNEVEALFIDHLQIADDAQSCAMKIAHAVTRSVGGEINFDSFNGERAR